MHTQPFQQEIKNDVIYQNDYMQYVLPFYHTTNQSRINNSGLHEVHVKNCNKMSFQRNHSEHLSRYVQ